MKLRTRSAWIAVATAVALAGVAPAAHAKFRLELDGFAFEPGEKAEVRGFMHSPRGFSLYLTGSPEELGPKARTESGHSIAKLLLVRVRDANGKVRVSFEVPNVVSGRYGIDACIDKDACAPIGDWPAIHIVGGRDKPFPVEEEKDSSGGYVYDPGPKDPSTSATSARDDGSVPIAPLTAGAVAIGALGIVIVLRRRLVAS